VVVLDGAVAGGGFTTALNIAGAAAGGTLLRGLEIVRWTGRALFINGTPDVVIAGNYIGTDGTSALGNGSGFMTFGGVIQTLGECRNLRIGGRSPADRNVFAGNAAAGVYIRSEGGARIEGNYMGTNAAGTAAVVPAGFVGVYSEAVDGVTVGGTAPGAGNVLSGMDRGAYLVGGGDVRILGNRIGTNAAGTVAIPNNFGIQLQSGVGKTIGGTTPAARNLISGNGIGVSIENSSDNVVQGNRIGTNAAGTGAVPNDVGVRVTAFPGVANRNQIGGSVAGAGNVISGNHTAVSIESGEDTVVRGNLIGVRPDGKTKLANDQAGVVLRHSGPGTLTRTRIGGIVPGAGNVIAFNGGPGIEIGDDDSVSSTSIRGNSIHGNDGLGIDLEPGGAPGITPNDDDDADTGPNGLQNFPVITQATSGAGGTSISGTLESNPAGFYTIDFYANDKADPSGAGEGNIYLGSRTVGTDGNGVGMFTQTFPKVLGNFVTATTTASPDTSEFSAPTAIVGPGGFRLGRTSFVVREGAGHVTVKVQRIGGTDGAVTVRFQTSNGTAKAPGDYHATTGTLNFAAGQKSTTFAVTIVNDAAHEPAESFTVRILDPGAGAALGAPTTAKVMISAND
jgi:parallel beta-helix repeat protein